MIGFGGWVEQLKAFRQHFVLFTTLCFWLVIYQLSDNILWTLGKKVIWIRVSRTWKIWWMEQLKAALHVETSISCILGSKNGFFSIVHLFTHSVHQFWHHSTLVTRAVCMLFVLKCYIIDVLCLHTHTHTHKKIGNTHHIQGQVNDLLWTTNLASVSHYCNCFFL